MRKPILTVTCGLVNVTILLVFFLKRESRSNLKKDRFILLGTMGFPDTVINMKLGQGTLYKLSDINCFQNLDSVVPNVSISNGLAWTNDGTRMFYIDSLTRKIAIFDYDPTMASTCNVFFTQFLLLLNSRSS